MKEGFQGLNPDGTPKLKGEKIIATKVGDETSEALHARYRAEDSKENGDGWHPAPQELLQAMDEVRTHYERKSDRIRQSWLAAADSAKRSYEFEKSSLAEEAKAGDREAAYKINERKDLDAHIQKNRTARTARSAGEAAVAAALEAPVSNNKALSHLEDQYVISHQQLSQHESAQEFRKAIMRERAQKKQESQAEAPKPYAPDEASPSSTEEEVRQASSGSSEVPQPSERFTESVLGSGLDLKVTGARLRKSTEAMGKKRDDLHRSEAALRAAAAMRAEHKKWADTLANAPASRREKRDDKKPGLRKEHAIPEKVLKKADMESVSLVDKEAQIKKDIEEKKRSLASEEKRHSELRQRAEVLIARERASAEKFIQPFQEQIAAARKAQKDMQESVDRYERFAADAEKRLNDQKMRLQDAQFDSQRTMLKELIRKDEMLLKRFLSRKPGFGVNAPGPNSIDGFKKKLAASEEKIRSCEAKIAMRREKVKHLETSILGRMDAASRPSESASAPEKPAEGKREEPGQKPPEIKPITSVSYRDKTFEIPYPEATPKSKEEVVQPKEPVAKKYADDWNKRYGSSFTIKRGELEKLMPSDREPDEREMDSILETFITARASRIWRLPGLSMIFSNITRGRIRAMRAARRS
jgi:hypothetical protein